MANFKSSWLNDKEGNIILPRTTISNVQDNDGKGLNQVIDSLSNKIPFALAVDENGNYGYIKAGADTVTPFKTGSSDVNIDIGVSNKVVTATKGRTASFTHNVTLTKGTWIVSTIVSASGGKAGGTSTSVPYATNTGTAIAVSGSCEIEELSNDDGAGYGGSYATYVSQKVVRCNIYTDTCTLTFSMKGISSNTSYASLYHIIPVKISDEVL